MQQPYTLQLECTRVHDLVVIHCSAGQSFLSIFFLFFFTTFSLGCCAACLAANYAGIPKYDSARHPIGQMGSTGIPSSSFIDVILSETAERYRHTHKNGRKVKK